MSQRWGKVKKSALPAPDPADLLAWYDGNRRALPWRAKPGRKPVAYHVWLSEIMLQQTTVAAVKSYYQKFVQRWPNVKSLAAASLDEILTAWAGLGYYRRARMLHQSAQIIVQDYKGKLPAQEQALRKLPGIGRYSAAAITAIAFNQRANVVDGNVARIMARLYAVKQPLRHAVPEIHRLAEKLLPDSRFGDYAQALMDLGATVCTPRQPQCGLCPWAQSCRAFQTGRSADYPVPAARIAKPIRRAVAFWLTDGNGHVWVRRRPDEGLLPGMVELPSSPWLEQPMPDMKTALPFAPAQGIWRSLPGEIRHSFTHFDLYIKVITAQGHQPHGNGFWTSIKALNQIALPSVMRKIAGTASSPSQE